MLDFQKIFLGSHFSWTWVVELIFRTLFLYTYTLIIIRFAGKQGLNTLTPFQLVIVVALGSALGDPMLHKDVSLIQGMVVITTMLLAEQFLLWLNGKSERVSLLVEGGPALVIKEGQVRYDELKRQRLTHQELLSMLRMKGIKDIGQVEYAFLESSGSLSVIMYENQSKEVQSTIALADEEVRKRL